MASTGSIRSGAYVYTSNTQTRFSIAPLNDDEIWCNNPCIQCERTSKYAVMLEELHEVMPQWRRQVTNHYVCSEGCFNMWLMKEGHI